MQFCQRTPEGDRKSGVGRWTPYFLLLPCFSQGWDHRFPSREGWFQSSVSHTPTTLSWALRDSSTSSIMLFSQQSESEVLRAPLEAVTALTHRKLLIYRDLQCHPDPGRPPTARHRGHRPTHVTECTLRCPTHNAAKQYSSVRLRNRERFITGPCEMGGSCPKKTQSPKGFQESTFNRQVREEHGCLLQPTALV